MITNFSCSHVDGSNYYGCASHGTMELSIQSPKQDSQLITNVQSDIDNNYIRLKFSTLLEWERFTMAVKRIDETLRQDLENN